MAASGIPLKFSRSPTPPRHPLPKPDRGRCHLIRFVRHEARIDIFGEAFRVPAHALYTYVRATIDVARQRWFIYQDGKTIDEHAYHLR